MRTVMRTGAAVLAAALIVMGTAGGAVKADAKTSSGVTLEAGKSQKVTVKNKNGKKLTISLSRKGIVKVKKLNKKAVRVTGLKAGKCRVVVRAGKKKAASFSVTVKAKTTLKKMDMTGYKKYSDQNKTIDGYKISLKYARYSELLSTGDAVIEVENTNKNIHPFAAVKNGSKLNAFAQNKFEIVGVGTGTCWAKGYADGEKLYLRVVFDLDELDSDGVKELKENGQIALLRSKDSSALMYFNLADTEGGKTYTSKDGVEVRVCADGVQVKSEKELSACVVTGVKSDGSKDILLDTGSDTGITSSGGYEKDGATMYLYKKLTNTNLFKLFQTGMDLSQYTAFYLDDEKL